MGMALNSKKSSHIKISVIAASKHTGFDNGRVIDAKTKYQFAGHNSIAKQRNSHTKRGVGTLLYSS